MEKLCNRCLKVKDYSEFFKEKQNKTDGLYGMCKSCKTKATYKWRKKNTKVYNSYMREYNKEHPKSLVEKRQKTDRSLRFRYKISIEEREKMGIDQDHRCAICGRHESESKKALHIDHCHATGKVRGLLCSFCNQRLHVLENREMLLGLLGYLKKYE